jgi:hypothetical protein
LGGEARPNTPKQSLDAFHAPPEPGMPLEAPPGMGRAYALWQTTRDYGMAYYEFELRWHMEMLARIKNLPPRRPPSPTPSSIPPE